MRSKSRQWIAYLIYVVSLVSFHSLLPCNCNNVMFFVSGTSVQTNVMDDKELPEKGEGECATTSEQLDNLLTGVVPPDLTESCSIDDDVVTQENVLPDNALQLTIFVSLPAYGPSLLGTCTHHVIKYIY